MQKNMKYAGILLIGLALLAGCAKSGNQAQPTPASTPPAGVSEEDLILNQGTEWELNARLTLPSGTKGPVPAVILVHGSGASDMNETIGACAPFRDLAYGLSKRGIAVLRFDKRTFTYGSRIANSMENFTVREESVDDAVAAAAYLRGDPRIDKTRIVGIGHSLGATLIPRIDAAGADFFAMVLLAGTPRPLWQVSYDQNIALIEKMTPEDRASSEKLVNEELDKAKKLSAMSDDEAKKITVFGMPGYYLKDLVKTLPQDILQKNAKPVLILQGTADFQVSPEKDYGLFKSALDGRPNTAFKAYDGLNHLFIKSSGPDQGSVNEYKTPGTVDENVVNDIANWVLAL